jgi:hypothetical protein
MTVKAGERLVATDITDLTFFPIGAVLMMDGSWQDGRGGWYICDGRGTPYGNTPNLQDKFIKGRGSKADNGNGQMTLGTQHLPSHKHSVSVSGGKHAHRFIFDHNAQNNGNAITMVGTFKYLTGADSQGNYGTNMANPRNIATESVETSESHTHTITIDNSTNGDQPFDVLPSYYSMIYIKKMA